MTAIPPEAITAAAIQHAEYRGFGDPDDEDRAIAEDMLVAAAMWMAAAERDRIANVIQPGRLRDLANWFDADDRFKTTMHPDIWPSRGHEVQDDLRAWADLLDGAP